MKNDRSAIIIGASSDIGNALCERWLKNGWEVFGTYRIESSAVHEMRNRGVNLVYCDVSDSSSIYDACDKLKKKCPSWDVLVMCPAIQGPLNSFMECNFNEWENSVNINFTNQMRMVHELLPLRRVGTDPEPCVLFFSGGGINEAPLNFSAYILSKIAAIKMCELLDAEIQDASFVVIGPGWVKTKIHSEMLAAGPKAGLNYQRTLEKFQKDDFTPMELVLDCCDWIVNTPKKAVSGRNISVIHDDWGNKEFEKKLNQDHDLLKLRKYGGAKK